MKTITDALIHYILSFFVLIYIIYEELIWERLAQPIFRYIQSLKLLQALEHYLKNVHGVVILIAFIILFGITELQGVYAGILLLKGKPVLWILLYAGKIPIAAFTFWLFRVSKPKLMAFPWFKKTYELLIRGIDWVQHTETYINIKTKAARLKKYFKKNYLREGDSTRQKIKRIYRRLRIRIKEILSR